MVCVGLPVGFLTIFSFFMSALCRPSPSDTSLILRVWPFYVSIHGESLSWISSHVARHFVLFSIYISFSYSIVRVFPAYLLYNVLDSTTLNICLHSYFISLKGLQSEILVSVFLRLSLYYSTLCCFLPGKFILSRHIMQYLHVMCLDCVFVMRTVSVRIERFHYH